MGIALGLLAALFYGASDFAAGVGGRRASSAAVAIMSQPIGLIASIIAVLALPASFPSESALAWGAASGFGGGMGTIALYRGLTVGSMGVVAPLSAVLAAALPAMIGIATGDSLSAVQVAGLALALPGVALISLQSPGPVDSGGAGVAEGLLAGVGFALLFIGLARAGTSAGAWPLVPCQAMAVATVVALGLGLGQPAGTWAGAWLPAIITGVLGGGANLLYLAATGKGQLSIVAVLTALYPAVTILLARGLLHEHWTRVQVVGLALSAVAIGLISVG
jgi:uncharacterized membrane protein